MKNKWLAAKELIPECKRCGSIAHETGDCQNKAKNQFTLSEVESLMSNRILAAVIVYRNWRLQKRLPRLTKLAKSLFEPENQYTLSEVEAILDKQVISTLADVEEEIAKYALPISNEFINVIKNSRIKVKDDE